MLVLLYFNELGYSPVAIAFLFLLYELMGVLTNLIGGWVGSRTGLNRTLIVGLGAAGGRARRAHVPAAELGATRRRSCS